jgi:hypothetical protein
VTSRAPRRGAIVWAIVPFDVTQPFRVAEPDSSETPYPESADLRRAVFDRKLGGEFELIVGAKLRPVVLLSNRPTGRLGDSAALRLTRLSKYDVASQQRIRDTEEEALFHLGHDRRQYGLDQEYAINLTSLHRVHHSAIAGAPVGHLRDGEYRTVCERMITVSDIDISHLVTVKAAEFIERLKQRREDR